jgi:hypothetical protein
VVLPRLAAARIDDAGADLAPGGLSNDVTAILEAIVDSGASNDDTIVAKRIKTTHNPLGQSAPQVRKRPKVTHPAGDRPVPTEFSIKVARTEPPAEKPAEKTVVEKTVVDRLMTTERPDKSSADKS